MRSGLLLTSMAPITSKLMRLAGYHVPVSSAPPAVLFAGAEKLDDEDRAEIQEIIQIKLRRAKGREHAPTRAPAGGVRS